MVKLPARINPNIIIECSGALCSRSKASGYLEAGAKRVIISAPSDDADAMIVLGVNMESYHPEEVQGRYPHCPWRQAAAERGCVGARQ